MLVFKKIEKGLKEINREIILQSNNKEAISDLKKRQKLLDEVKEFMLTFEWITHTKAKEKLACFIESDFNYTKVAEEFNTTLDSARASISQLGKLFEKEISIETLDDIINGNLSKAEYELSKINNSYKGLFVSDLRPLLPDGEIDEFVSLSECKRELSYLLFFTNKRLNEGLKRLDTTKLCHIIAILEDTEGTYAKEKELINGYLQGKIKNWDNFEALI